MAARQFASFSRNFWPRDESFRWASSGQRWSAEIWHSPQRGSRTAPSPPKSLAAKTTEPGSGSSISSRLPLRWTALSPPHPAVSSFIHRTFIRFSFNLNTHLLLLYPPNLGRVAPAKYGLPLWLASLRSSVRPFLATSAVDTAK